MEIIIQLLLIIIINVGAKKVDLPPIVIQNYKFYDSTTNEYVAIKGIDYYPRPNAGQYDINNFDFFNDDFTDVWMRDIPYIAATGANAIRLYSVDPSKNHDNFMCTLANYGIYVIIDLQTNGCEILSSPAPDCYPAALKIRGQQIISTFSKYSNVLAYSAGNEINYRSIVEYGNIPCQKRFIRDMRKYIAGCNDQDSNFRRIPVGVVMADYANQRKPNAEYFNCLTTNDPYEQAEWYGLNVYLNCDGAVTDGKNAVGYEMLKSDIMDIHYSIPFVLTEYGCLSPSFPTQNGYEAQRSFYEAEWFYTSEYRQQIAGAFVFEYSTENANSRSTSPYPFNRFGPQNYGLGFLSPENCDDVTIKCTYNPMPTYFSLQNHYKSSIVSDEPLRNVSVADSTRLAPSTCPSTNISQYFGPLNAYNWLPDTQQDMMCPKHESFQCRRFDS